MDDLFINKLVKIKNVMMPDDLSQWLGFIEDRFYTQHPYVPKVATMNIIIEELEPQTKTGVGYISLTLQTKPYYVPIIINKGELEPLDVIVDITGKTEYFSKEFYINVKPVEKVFGHASDRGKKMDATVNDGPQIIKQASHDNDLLYCIIKRAGFNDYKITGIYANGEKEEIDGNHKLIKEFMAENLVKKAGIGDESVLLPHDKPNVILTDKHNLTKSVRKYYDTPGTYKVLDGKGNLVVGSMFNTPLNMQPYIFIAKNGYSLLNTIYATRVSDKISLDNNWIQPHENLEDIVMLMDKESHNNAGYIYGGTSCLAIEKIMDLVHVGDVGYYKVGLIEEVYTTIGVESTVGLVIDNNLAIDKLIDISNDEKAKGDFLKDIDKVYLIGNGFITIPANPLTIAEENTKIASYKGTDKYTYSIKRGEHIFTTKGERCVGTENMVKIAFARHGFSEEDYSIIKSASDHGKTVIFSKKIEEVE